MVLYENFLISHFPAHSFQHYKSGSVTPAGKFDSDSGKTETGSPRKSRASLSSIPDNEKGFIPGKAPD